VEPRQAAGRPRRGHGALVFAVLLVASLSVPTGLAARAIRVVVGGPGQTTVEGPLPACRANDILALHRDPDDWSRTLLDPTFALAPEDEPSDLVPVAEADIPGAGSVRLLVVDDLRALTRAARLDGVHLRVRSAFRSFDDQVRTVDSLERAYGHAWTTLSAAQPGHSEHQLGTTLDLDGGDAWLGTHAWEHGFVVSYPADRSPTFTCYKPEPWHVRYVGRTEAVAVHDSGLSLREWLWLHPDGIA
jgi:D-alanyl-D-alanine carboxypeptidase